MIPEREQLQKKLRELRLRLCCYLSENFCDCKYLKGEVPEDKQELHRFKMEALFKQSWGEQTGCCELRVMQALVAKMTDEEFLAILRR